MPYNSIGFGDGILSLRFPSDLHEEEKNKTSEELPLVEDFAKKLVRELSEETGNAFKIIFEVKVPRGYSRSSLSIALVVKGPVATGFIVGEEISFWRDQFWVLDKMYLDVEQANENFEKIVERFRKIIALTKPFLDALGMVV
ncbi:MAG: hypothetical protein US63_C0036G0007 [Candidatus Moranbacteria bacterium GW2011_GWC2_37_8]|nr:MAG: hypothetical protein US63_C0036G0007 [Candidatus Moranbacteria bacterium GW2011_GWC2_37_8]KKQ60623.1 MAG: hypothetical protein US82_C0031G0004 [Parcubacteria group bacterium GW2011_GWC1_38_22]KKQ80625.1 MAG: hypothetical protein UT03_C0021G0008 [Candidatus Moranbacteria bacterium GW2011_GWD2_38_7]